MALKDLQTRLQQPGLIGNAVQSLPGVATLSLPQHNISADLDRLVQAELDKLDPGVTTAALNLHTKTGVNIIVASRINQKLTATLWIGKSGWSEPINEGWAGSLSVRGTWGATK